MLSKVKTALRISNAAFDEEIQDLIDAAKLDLLISGVGVIEETDPLIKRAILTYCKANFGFDNPDSVRLQKAYDSLKVHMSLVGDYHLIP